MVLGEVSQGAGGAGGGGAMAEGARARLTELEVRLPWTSVKKSWGPRREQWVSQVLSTLACDTLANLVLLLEGAIKTETFDPSWPDVRDEWKARVSAARTPEAIDQVVMQLERAIQWKGIQLNRAGTIARPLPAPSICDDPSLPPPDGIPRASLRIMLILRAMGIRSYSPAVVIQLYEIMHAYGAELLLDASHYARARQLREVQGESGNGGSKKRPLEPTILPDVDGIIERADVALAVRTRMSRLFVRPPPREMLAQHAAECNLQPLPLLASRQAEVQLPSTKDCLPASRSIVQRGLLDADEEGAVGALEDLTW